MSAARPDHDLFVPVSGNSGWHKIADSGDFVKWQYGDGPYRLVAHLRAERGHWETIFTSWYPGPSHLVRGNCGGDKQGKLTALAAAHKFISDHEYGCPPPGEMV